jgi:hypothetical protein
MKARLLPAAILVGAVGLSMAWCAETPSEEGAVPIEDAPVTLEVARDRARLMHTIYSTTLEVLHDRYFHGQRAMVPARAMEDVFDGLDRKLNVSARWISVNTKPMSITHEPKREFDKKAAAELAEGKAEYESIEDGRYYRATPIVLGAGCVSCHDGFFRAPPKSPRFAGLIVTMPLKQE